MKKVVLLILFLSFVIPAISQTTYKENSLPIKRSHTFDPTQAKPMFNAYLLNLEAPVPNGSSYKSFLMGQKIKSRNQYPLQENVQLPSKKSSAPQPIVGDGFKMTMKLFNGNIIDYSGGIPNDNTLAISNGGILLAAINSVIWAYDIKHDSSVFPTNVLALQTVANGSIAHHYYDPKVLYDEEADRFILVFLRDNQPGSSAYMVCFSSTNNPADPWYVYHIPGNPLDNNRWTDFPAINITNDELFITGNLVIPGVSWQVGFDGSVIWQIDKNAGYNNDSVLPNKLYSDIRYNGKFTRNVHPVTGTGSSTSSQYFLSNRNFDISNDTIFVMEINGTLDDPATELKVGMGKTSPAYGVPPNARQQDTDISDPTKGLQTNDARVLGAITNGDWIQFVSTTVNPATGLAAIYHGTISNPGKSNQSISGTILGDAILDFGYPNIAFTGNEPCDIEAIIGVNFSSPTDFPGTGAFYYSNDSSYSEFVRLRDGMNYVDRLSDSYERWGDYFGIQPKYDEPGKVWTAGFIGLANKRNGTWFNQLSSPDPGLISVQLVETGKSVFCQGRLQLQASGGIPPYKFAFNGGVASSSNIFDSICDGDTILYTVSDSRGCTFSDTLLSPNVVAGTDPGVYPNPFTSNIVVQFNLDSDTHISAIIFDMQGKLVATILNSQAKKGLNELHFDLTPLRTGIYVVRIVANDKEIINEKIFKRE